MKIDKLNFKTIYYALVPLFILLCFAVVASILSYFILLIAGDIVSMRKIISKATQIFLLFSIFPMRRYLKLTWSDIGFSPKSIFLKQFINGFLLGLLTLMPVLIVLYGFDISILDQARELSIGKVMGQVLVALVLALLISFGEEPLFSGILFAGLKKKMAIGLAAVLSATYYASFHFVKTKTNIPYEELTVASGFQLMAEAFKNILNPEITSAFIALLVVGLFLITIRIHFKSGIGICIGCHAAWVWQIKMGKFFFNTNPDSAYYYLVSSYYDGVVGPLVSVWLSFLLMSYFIWRKFFR